MFFIFFPGFFVDINLYKANKERAAELAKNSTNIAENGSSGASGRDGLADEDANLMIKLKFLTYKVKIQWDRHSGSVKKLYFQLQNMIDLKYLVLPLIVYLFLLGKLCNINHT